MTGTEDIQSVAITGPNGLVGTELRDLLSQEDKSVVGISRSAGGVQQESIRWSPETGLTNPARLESVDAIVHLAGENIGSGRWTEAKKRVIRSSRIEGTRNLVQSIAAIDKRPQVLISASAIGYYGDRGDLELTESAGPGSGFLAELCQEWEAEANAAKELGVRVVNIRIGVVLNPKGGALGKMLLPFKLGLGGVVGSGKQYWSWVGLSDLVRIISFCLNDPEISGPVNAVSPEAMTNREFTKRLAKHLHRPAFFPLPAFAAKIALGEMAQGLLLNSSRVIPAVLQDRGFEFSHPTLEECLTHELSS